MKKLLITSAWLALLATSEVDAKALNTINGRQGVDLCQQAISALAEDTELDFQRESASSLRGSNFSFWINASGNLDDQKGPLRYRCEISREGEILDITQEKGRWKI